LSFPAWPGLCGRGSLGGAAIANPWAIDNAAVTVLLLLSRTMYQDNKPLPLLPVFPPVSPSRPFPFTGFVADLFLFLYSFQL
jgi:hypothetical protein